MTAIQHAHPPAALIEPIRCERCVNQWQTTRSACSRTCHEQNRAARLKITQQNTGIATRQHARVQQHDDRCVQVVQRRLLYNLEPRRARLYRGTQVRVGSLRRTEHRQ